MKFWSWISKENFFIPRNSIGRLLPWLWSETVFFSYLFPTLKVKKNYPESLLEVTVQVPKPCSQRLLIIWFEVGREDMSLQQALWLSRCHWDPDEASGITKVFFTDFEICGTPVNVPGWIRLQVTLSFSSYHSEHGKRSEKGSITKTCWWHLYNTLQ